MKSEWSEGDCSAQTSPAVLPRVSARAWDVQHALQRWPWKRQPRCSVQRRLCCAQYMDRIYVKHQNRAPVAQLGLDLWRDHVVRQKGIRDRMLSMLLELIHRERTGDIVDRALLRSITMVRWHSPSASAWAARGAHHRYLRLDMLPGRLLLCCRMHERCSTGSNLARWYGERRLVGHVPFMCLNSRPRAR